jgi:hypothetical protein
MIGPCAPSQGLRWCFGTLAAAFLIASQLPGASANGEVRIDRSTDALQVKAHDSSIADVLAALGASFEHGYGKPTNLDRPISGAFSGTLSEILALLLEDYDYVATISESGQAEIVWISPSARPPEGAPAPPRIARVPPALASAGQLAKALDPKQMVLPSQVRGRMVQRAEMLKRQRALQRP